MDTGIYEINNIITGKKYIGSSKQISYRWSVHIKQLKDNTHANNHLQSAWNKYGAEAFEFSIVHQCELDQLIICEQWMIDQYNFDELYNICPNAGSCLGRKFSIETRAKQSAAATGRKLSIETRAKISNSLKGIIFSAERCSNISNTKKGKIGKSPSLETREKMSVQRKGKKLSVEHRAKMSAGWKLRAQLGIKRKKVKFSDERRANMSAQRKGKKCSTATRAKISATLKKRKLVDKESQQELVFT